eukprot:30889-Pelagococcus_subviridis.AAC.3
MRGDLRGRDPRHGQLREVVQDELLVLHAGDLLFVPVPARARDRAHASHAGHRQRDVEHELAQFVPHRASERRAEELAHVDVHQLHVRSLDEARALFVVPVVHRRVVRRVHALEVDAAFDLAVVGLHDEVPRGVVDDAVENGGARRAHRGFRAPVLRLDGDERVDVVLAREPDAVPDAPQPRDADAEDG